jgi:hypothetical protein
VSEAVSSRQAKVFFDEFVEAFATFDGNEIARRYRVPYLAVQAEGTGRVFQTRAAIAEYFQRIVDGYQSGGCRSCRYGDLEVTAIGRDAALGTVTWDLLRAEGSAITSWRESYLLVRADERLETLASIDHPAP